MGFELQKINFVETQFFFFFSDELVVRGRLVNETCHKQIDNIGPITVTFPFEIGEQFHQGISSNVGKVKKQKTVLCGTPYQVFKPEKRVTCHACGLIVATRGHLERHQRSHGANNTYKCYLCDCSFTRKKKVLDHLDKAHGIMTPKFAI